VPPIFHWTSSLISGFPRRITGHDLLFDSGLQFRPTAGWRKRDTAETYWAAVLRELECGCTCATFDYANRPVERLCACAQFPVARSRPVLAVSNRCRRMTVRMPYRLPPLLAELLAILLSVIQPLPATSTGVYMQESTASLSGQKYQARQHAAQAALLREVLDPEFIRQEGESSVGRGGLRTTLVAVINSYTVHSLPRRLRSVRRVPCHRRDTQVPLRAHARPRHRRDGRRRADLCPWQGWFVRRRGQGDPDVL
jgi:hypothetical protein